MIRNANFKLFSAITSPIKRISPIQPKGIFRQYPKLLFSTTVPFSTREYRSFRLRPKEFKAQVEDSPIRPESEILNSDFGQGYNSNKNQSSSPSGSVLGGSVSFVFLSSVIFFGASALFIQYSVFNKAKSSPEKVKSWVQSLIETTIGADDLKTNVSGFGTKPESTWELLKSEIQSKVDHAREEFSSLSKGKQYVWGIIGINGIVFLLWRIPRLEQFMSRHFLHFPQSDRYYTMLTSCFSHKEIWHFAFNMMALNSFGGGVASFMSGEQLVAFYLTTGVISSLMRRLAMSTLKHRLGLNPLIPSLGASGALFGLTSLAAYNFPSAQSNIIFLPMINFDLSQLLAGLMLLDFIGIVRGWKIFDHYAHLGGAVFGLFYGKFGTEYIWLPMNRAVLKIRRFISKYT